MGDNLSRVNLYQLQDAVIEKLQSIQDSQFATAKLCGGTALARCWLDHRISYDLDFFLPYGFKAGAMATALKKAEIFFKPKTLLMTQELQINFTDTSFMKISD